MRDKVADATKQRQTNQGIEIVNDSNDRDARLAAALRSNLKRRKSQAKTRRDDAPATPETPANTGKIPPPARDDES
ncbi:hypothetical protein [Acuticoccus sp. I52.16.1]|uniref:hypothetical protein n=1 Tax=Acuticoccus sp. I52.16.1 TaxID=2928472 RepID=UPI001FD4AD6D|nr:hypothetical protein [Acuticoccus sp. I52.16.1]UOM36211.1 hypothetical protein MRB58_08490 [Acuticoccus sp. I52.16.1]